MASSGNFCTLNRLGADGGDTNARVGTITKGNLHTYSGITDRYGQAMGTHGVATGKWYTEWYISVGGFPSWLVGWYHGNQVGIYDGSGTSNVANFCSMGYFTGTYIYLTPFGSTSTSGGTSNRQPYSSFTNQGVPTTGDVIMNCMDFDAGKGWWGINGVWGDSGSGAGDPANDSNPNLTWTVADYADHKFPITLNWTQSGHTNGEITFNAGQDSTFSGAITAGGNADGNGFGDFKYAPPSGFLALCSANLPISDDIDPAQTDDDFGEKLFSPIIWTGNGSTNNITGLGFQPDLVWTKGRSTTYNNRIWDSSRGVQKYLDADSFDAEATLSTGLTAFDSDGFTLGSGGSQNSNGATYVAWCWRLNGGTTASNTSGDINSTTQASDKTGLSIVTYTGNGSQGQSIGHSLTKAPEMVWFKNRDQGSTPLEMDWIVALSTSTGSPFASLSGSSQCLELNNSNNLASKYRNEGNFTPTTSTFSVPANGNAPYWFNRSGDDYVAYCWHSVEGFSKFGLYEGNGDADGTFVYTGFRPRMLFVKSADSASGDWIVIDTVRSTSNLTNAGLSWNANYAEATSNRECDIVSNGFKIRTSNTNLNKSSETYLFGAWGDVSFKYNNTF
jgi:hypothetical protein